MSNYRGRIEFMEDDGTVFEIAQASLVTSVSAAGRSDWKGQVSKPSGSFGPKILNRRREPFVVRLSTGRTARAIKTSLRVGSSGPFIVLIEGSGGEEPPFA